MIALQASSVAGIVTAAASLLSAFAVLLGTLIVARPALRKLGHVEHLVNQAHTDGLRYQRVLAALLRAHDIPVPDDEALNDPPPNPRPATDERLGPVP